MTMGEGQVGPNLKASTHDFQQLTECESIDGYRLVDVVTWSDIVGLTLKYVCHSLTFFTRFLGPHVLASEEELINHSL